MDVRELLVCLCALLSCVWGEVQITVQEPIKKTGPDMALVIIPQSNVNATQYTELGDALQSAAGTFRLWVGYIGGWEDGVPNLLEMDHGFLLMLRRLYELGLAQHAPVMVAGHGYGGATLSDYVDLHPDMFKALVLLSHGPPWYQKITEFTLPTLFLAGDMDGLTTVFSAAHLFQELMTAVPTNPDMVFDNPVVTLTGVNHTHYFSGQIPTNLTYSDIEGDASYAVARANISHYVVNFMIVQAQQPEQDVAAAKVVIRGAYNDNQERMGAILAVEGMDQNADGHSPWTEQSQSLLVGLQGHDVNRLQVSSDVVSEAALPGTRPTVTVNNSVVTVETFAEVTPPRHSGKGNTTYSPLQLQSKMKRKSAILALLPNATAMPQNLTCKDLNEASYNAAVEGSSAVAIQRFRKRGRPILYHPDIEATTGLGWVTKQLELDYSAEGLRVTSHALVTPDHFIIKSLAGMHYCKLLAPSRAMEWIYVDSLRGTKAVNNT